MALGKNQIIVLAIVAGGGAAYHLYNASVERQVARDLEQRQVEAAAKLAETQKARAAAVAAAAAAPAPAPSASVVPLEKAELEKAAPVLNAMKAELDAMKAAKLAKAAMPEKEEEPKKLVPKKLVMDDRGLPPAELEDATHETAPADGKKTVFLSKDAEEKSENASTERKQPKASQAKKTQDLARMSKQGLGAFIALWTEEYGNGAWPELISLAADRSLVPGQRYFALQAALELGGKSAREAVQGLLKDRDPGVRCLSLLGLGEMKELKAVRFIAPLLEDRAMVVRDCALLAVVRTDAQASRPLILSVIADAKNYVRGNPLLIVRRSFELLHDIDPQGHQTDEACKTFKERAGAKHFSTNAKKWSICGQ